MSENNITPLDSVRAAAAEARVLEPMLPDTKAGEGPSKAEGPVKVLSETCPVRPLGVSGNTYYYLDALRQLQPLSASDHTRLGIMALFRNQVSWLHKNFTNFNKKGVADGWKPELAQESLMTAASNKGVWDPTRYVRGPGAWRGGNGELVLHCGDAVFTAPSRPGETGLWHSPGLIGDHVYPAADAIPRPHEVPAEGEDFGVGNELLDLFKTWIWRRGELDARLLLGWIAAAMIGGALKWRPVVWITGGAGTGKSTLHEVVNGLFDTGIVSVADATAAGIWQKIGYATLPVAFDELEAEEDNRKSSTVIKLARMAASGALMLRGGADHQSTQFEARNCFMFSSILVPPLTTQDRSRMAILELGQLPIGKKAPVLDHRELRRMGNLMRRRLCDGWIRWPETFEMMRVALQAQGYSSRGADVFGGILAAADLIIYDRQLGEEEAHALAAQLAEGYRGEQDENERDEERCASHMISTVIDPHRGGARTTVGEWIIKAAGLASFNENVADANNILGTYGLKVVEGGTSRKKYLAVANYHRGLDQIFQNSHWAGKSGTQGVWVQALRRLPGAERGEKPVWFSGKAARCTLIPVESVISKQPQVAVNGHEVVEQL